MAGFNIPTDKFLALSANILHGVFLGKNKAVAKKNFKKLIAGEKIPVGKLGPDDASDKVELLLELDQKAFRGTLTFHLFGKVLSSMLQGISKRLSAESKQEVRTFTNAQTGQVIFFVPGFVEEDGRLNMLVTSVKKTPGKAVIQLLFLDPEQFKQKGDQASEGMAGGDGGLEPENDRDEAADHSA